MSRSVCSHSSTRHVDVTSCGCRWVHSLPTSQDQPSLSSSVPVVGHLGSNDLFCSVLLRITILGTSVVLFPGSSALIKPSSFPCGESCFVLSWGNGAFVLRHSCRMASLSLRHLLDLESRSIRTGTYPSTVNNLGSLMILIGQVLHYQSHVNSYARSLVPAIFSSHLAWHAPFGCHHIPMATSQSKSGMSVPSPFQVAQFWPGTGSLLCISHSHRKKQSPLPSFGCCVWMWCNHQAATR